MVAERTTDGRRLAELLASELTGEENGLAVVDADRDVEPTADGALAYRVVRAGDGENDGEGDGESADDGDVAPVAEVYVHPDRVRVEFRVAVDAVAEAGDEAGLRVRPKATRPPRTLVFVEDGAEVKRVLRAFEAAAGAA